MLTSHPDDQTDWNCYPGARVDTPVPTYQLTAPESYETWDWKQRFPGGEELKAYFKNLDKVWDLSRDITYDTRVTSMRWDADSSRWHCQLDSDKGKVSAWAVVLCTGFASKLYIPPYRNLDHYKGVIHHTAAWPQSGVNLDNKRVAVIGTGASGVQAIQEIAKVAKHLTVFQRTPNTALPMQNPEQTADMNQAMRDDFISTAEKMRKTFAGFDYEFNFTKPMDVSKEERMAFYDALYKTGGLHFWLGTYMNVLFEPEANEEAYQFWRAKTLPRIKDAKVGKILAPEKKIHPFGTKRISLESEYFEIFNQENVDIVDVRANPIDEFTHTGIKVSQQEAVRDFDVIVLATGFDSITGGITQIDIRGTDPELTIKEKWQEGTYTQLGMTTSGTFFVLHPSVALEYISIAIICCSIQHSQSQPPNRLSQPLLHLRPSSPHSLRHGTLQRREPRRVDRRLSYAHA